MTNQIQETKQLRKDIDEIEAKGWEYVSKVYTKQVEGGGYAIEFRRPNTKIEPTSDGLKL